MPWILQMFGFAVMLLGIGIALWVSVWLLVILFTVGVVVVIWSHLRDFLTKKGILNEKFGVPPEGAEVHEQVTIVEGEFTHVDEADEVTKD